MSVLGFRQYRSECPSSVSVYDRPKRLNVSFLKTTEASTTSTVKINLEKKTSYFISYHLPTTMI